MDRFDTIEIRAGRTLAEADYFWKHQARIPAARLDLPPSGIMARVRKAMGGIFMKEEKL